MSDNSDLLYDSFDWKGEKEDFILSEDDDDPKTPWDSPRRDSPDDSQWINPGSPQNPGKDLSCESPEPETSDSGPATSTPGVPENPHTELKRRFEEVGKYDKNAKVLKRTTTIKHKTCSACGNTGHNSRGCRNIKASGK
jgi:hypothetical protein